MSDSKQVEPSSPAVGSDDLGTFILGILLPQTSEFIVAITQVVITEFPNATMLQNGATLLFYNPPNTPDHAQAACRVEPVVGQLESEKGVR